MTFFSTGTNDHSVLHTCKKKKNGHFCQPTHPSSPPSFATMNTNRVCEKCNLPKPCCDCKYPSIPSPPFKTCVPCGTHSHMHTSILSTSCSAGPSWDATSEPIAQTL
jgi:hypothetical protein